MKRKFPFSYVFLAIALLILLSLPKDMVEKMRGSTMAMFAPLWHKLMNIKAKLPSYKGSSLLLESNELDRLHLENTLLRAEISRYKEALKHSLTVQKFLHFQAIPARIIFRSFSSWNSSFWIDVGSETNAVLGSNIILKNSPVLVGVSVVGVVDYVGAKQSRVRLITDAGLTPSVRALRGHPPNHLVIEKISALSQLLEKEQDFFETPQEYEDLLERLSKAAHYLSKKNGQGTFYSLAKGEIHGAGKPLWRTRRHELQGTGFNYDYADGEGPARDLRSGRPVNDSKESAMPILKVGDFLVTTGMDGVFPAGLLVAQVSHVHALKEGDYYYDLEALPTAGNLDELSSVCIIPPIGYDPDNH